jgi:hypothetical protein
LNGFGRKVKFSIPENLSNPAKSTFRLILKKRSVPDPETLRHSLKCTLKELGDPGSKVCDDVILWPG